MEVLMKGVKTPVDGVQPTVNESAPDFVLKNADNKDVSLKDFKGEIVLLSVFPDINTSVCDMQTRKFFALADTLDNVKIVNVSNNTIEEQKDWCATAGLEAEMLSDVNLDFANAYGLFLPEFKLLARSVFVIDQNGVLVYSEIVDEIASEPDYDKAINAAKALA